MTKNALPGLCALLLLSGCELAEAIGPGSGDEDWNLDAAYQWTLEGWETNGTRPVGHPAVLVTWDLPIGWNGEPFRVYAKDSDDSRYGLAATVTSCSGGSCSYADRNVVAGESYDYYVTLLDRNDREGDASDEIRVALPGSSRPATPGGVVARALDDAVFVQWVQTEGAQRYLVYLQDGADLITVGDTDGTSYLDSRAENGNTYQYRVAAVDESGHFSDLSATVGGTPRPDYHAEVIFAHADSARLSGFRFPGSDATDPLLRGDDASAQWRLEMVNGVLSLRPLGATRVTGGSDSSELTCGPGSDSDCVSIDRAPVDASFQTGPVAARPAQTYVFRVTGADGQPHFGKVRVLGTTTIEGRNAMVFDWAYQLRAGEPSLNQIAR